jgi:hypothetical protein
MTLKNKHEFARMAYSGGENTGGVAKVMGASGWDIFGFARS